MRRIVILDYDSEQVIIRNFPEELEDALDWFDSEYNDEYLIEGDCDFMVVDDLIINSK
jgi:hypothetical protein